MKQKSEPNQSATFSTLYPRTTEWVQDCGWIEIGYSDGPPIFVRALDEGGTVWEGKKKYPSIELALDDLEQALDDYMTNELGL